MALEDEQFIRFDPSKETVIDKRNREWNDAMFQRVLSKMEGRTKDEAQSLRKIDAVRGNREVPMKVLCLGYPRPGTSSLVLALRQLGYNPYFYGAAMCKVDTHMSAWEEAMRAKFYGQGTKYGRAEFDKLLGDFDVRGPIIFPRVAR